MMANMIRYALDNIVNQRDLWVAFVCVKMNTSRRLSGLLEFLPFPIFQANPIIFSPLQNIAPK